MTDDESTFNFSADDGGIIQETHFDEENIVDISEDDVEVKEDADGEPKQAEIDAETGEIKQ
ncbi:MAG: hypothetical protein V8R50_00915 [Clostridia bacterium]